MTGDGPVGWATAAWPLPTRFAGDIESSTRGLRKSEAHPTGALLAAALLILTPSSPAAAQSAECLGGQKPQQVAELFFGRNIGDRLGVTQAVWASFVDREITPRFPDGVTVFDVKGQWRDQGRKTIVHEPSKVVEIVLPGKDDDLDRLNQIATAYKNRFRQHSVGIVMRGACVSF